MRKIWRVALVLAAVLGVWAMPAAAAEDGSRIELFDIEVSVNEDNTYHVEQNLRVRFSDYGDQHGIYERIELRPFVSFEEDGQFYARDYRIYVRNVRASAGLDLYAEDDVLFLRLGDEDAIVDGETIDYEISYDYDVGDDGYPGFDMFYYGLVGNDWELPIDRTEFQVEMPKEFDTAAVGFSVGYTGDTGYNPDLLHYTVTGTVIEGSYSGLLEPYEGIWIRISLPAGYYTDVRTLDGAGMICLWAAVGLTSIVLVLYFCMRQRHRELITVEVNAPAGLTPADIGYIVDGSVDDKDVLSLLIYWADEGCLRIVEIANEDGTQAKKPDFLFVRLRDLPLHANEYERLMFDEMFSSGDRVSTKDLRNKFYLTIRDTKKRIAKRFSNQPDQVFRHSSQVVSDICSGFAAVPPAFVLAISAYYVTYVGAIAVIAGVFSFFIGFLLYAGYTQLLLRWQSTVRSSRRTMTILWIVATAGFLALVSVAGWSVCGPYALVVAGGSLLMGLLAPLLRQRTRQSRIWLGQILGLKRFIERAEKDRLEMLVAERPEYFYHILPYAYVLGVSDVWSRQFEDLATPPPDWYAGGTDYVIFSPIVFNTALMQTLETSHQAMVSQPGGSSGGGSGFSGGGVSGGGFGGSGGGTW